MTRLVAIAFNGPTIRTRMLPGGIQYVEIPNFVHAQASGDFMALIDNLDESVVKGLIIDVRYNPGGEEYVGAGIKPDLETWPTRLDLASDRDAVLEKAM